MSREDSLIYILESENHVLKQRVNELENLLKDVLRTQDSRKGRELLDKYEWDGLQLCKKLKGVNHDVI